MKELTAVDVVWALERLADRQTAEDIKQMARDILLRWMATQMLAQHLGT